MGFGFRILWDSLLTYCTCSRSTDADIAERVHFWIIENTVSGRMFSERRSQRFWAI